MTSFLYLGDLYGRINAQRGILFQEDQVGRQFIKCPDSHISVYFAFE